MVRSVFERSPVGAIENGFLQDLSIGSQALPAFAAARGQQEGDSAPQQGAEHHFDCGQQAQEMQVAPAEVLLKEVEQAPLGDDEHIAEIFRVLCPPRWRIWLKG